MRIDLLSAREPFHQVFCDTMAGFLEKIKGKKHTMNRLPQKRSGGLTSEDGAAGQLWLYNNFLNAVFTPDAGSELLSPAVKAFSRSVIKWRRIPQKLYIELAAAKPFRRLLAHGGYRLSPPLEDAGQYVIIPGNNKIKLIDSRNHCAYGILKSGFTPIFFNREIEIIPRVTDFGLPVPKLIKSSPEEKWYLEEIFKGTPLNRMKNVQQAQAAARSTLATLRRWLDHSSSEESMTGYLESLCNRVKDLSAKNALLSGDKKSRLGKDTDNLYQVISDRKPDFGDSLRLSESHGDFQPGNIIADGDKTWLIDWEYSRFRQPNYDFFVLNFNTRLGAGRAEKLAEFVLQGKFDWQWTPPENDKLEKMKLTERYVLCSFFILEELALQLEENSTVVLTLVGRCVLNLVF